MGKKLLMGLEIEVLSTLGNESKNAQEIRRHWDYFMSRSHELDSIIKGFSYGVLASADGFMENEKFTDLASVEVKKNNQKDISDFKLHLIDEETQYACFEMTGNQKSCQVTADYIYGIWLPQSKYERDEGVDIEIFDHKLYEQERISFYGLPIKK